MYIDINKFIEYEKEFSRVLVSIPLDREYSRGEFENAMKDNIENKKESEPEEKVPL